MSKFHIDIKLDKRQERSYRAVLKGFRKGYPRAAARALNTTARWMRTQIVRAVSSRYKVKQKLVRERSWIQLAKAAGKLGPNLHARVSLGGLHIAYYKMGARQTRKGVTFRLGQGRRQLAASSFIATMQSGHVGVFERLGPPRLPIRELFGPAIMDLYATTGLAGTLEDDAANRLEKNMDTQVRLLLARGRA